MGSTGSRQTSVKNFLQSVILFGPQNYPAWPCRSVNSWSMTKHMAYIRPLGYIFFSSSVSCIPIHELMQTRTKWDGAVIDKRALMNVIWRRMPEYAVLANRWEQTGQNSILSVILPQLEFEQERVIQNDHMITMFPDAGEDYQLFKKAGAAAQSTQNPSTE